MSGEIEHGGLCINSLMPNELLQLLFTFLPSKDLFACRLVCRRWEAVVDECVGVELHIGHPKDPPWYQSEHNKFKNLSAITEFGANRCSLSCLRDRRINPNLTWKKATLVKYLWIDGKIRPALFNHLTKDLSQLQELVIHFSTLLALSVQNVAELKLGTLANLKQFKIVFKYAYECPNMANLPRGILNLVKLLESSAVTFPRLRTVGFSFPCSREFTWAINRAIWEFLLRHAQSLKRLELGYFDSESEGLVIRLPDNPGNELTSADIRGFDLEAVEIISHILWDDDPELRFFKPLLDEQLNLKELSLVSYQTDFHLVEILSLIQNCNRTLTKLIFSVDIGMRQPGVPLNLACISQCLHLKTLSLAYNGLISRAQSALPDVTFGSSPLPRSFEVIKLRHILITSQDILNILDDKPSLQELQLMHVGTLGNLGIPFERLVEMIAGRKVTVIDILNSVNARSLRAALQSENPSFITMASLVMGFGTERTGSGWLRLALTRPGRFYETYPYRSTGIN